MPGVRRPASRGSVPRRRLAVAEVMARPLDDLAEPDHGHDVVGAHGAAVDLLQEVRRLLQAAKLRVVMLDVARRELLDALHLDVVDHGREDLLAGTVAEADGHPDHLAALVFAALVAQADGRGLATTLELIDEDRGIEVEDVDPAAHAASVSDARTTQKPSAKSPDCGHEAQPPPFPSRSVCRGRPTPPAKCQRADDFPFRSPPSWPPPRWPWPPGRPPRTPGPRATASAPRSSALPATTCWSAAGRAT